LVKAFGGKAFENKSAYFAEGYGGASLWLPPDVHPNEEAMPELIQYQHPYIGASDARYEMRGTITTRRIAHPASEFSGTSLA
jgi:hypothetical protein